MILMKEVSKLGGEARDEFLDTIIATAAKESSVAESAMGKGVVESSVVGVNAKSMGKSIATKHARGEERHESTVGRRLAESAGGGASPVSRSSGGSTPCGPRGA